MKNLKKILAVVLALAMLLCFAGCGEDNSNKLIIATNAEFEPFESLDADGNYVCDTCGSELEQPEKSFFDKILDFFRSIIDWFKNLFS